MEDIQITNAKLATCNLNQWAMDFEGNKTRIMESIKIAKEQNCTYRLGPELEIPGYLCEDHFLELDTERHSWEILTEIIKSDLTDNIICDFGLPVLHHAILYNCRVLVLNKKLLLIRPKMVLADDGNYRESRWFTAWVKTELEDYLLPKSLQAITGQKYVPFGIAIIKTLDTEIGNETCEELWQPNSPHISMGLDGAEIFANGSGSHFELGKINSRLNLLKQATNKSGGVYLYSNQRGCDGDRLYFDGCAMIALNGHILTVASQFSLLNVEVITAVIDLETVREFRLNVKSRCNQASHLKQSYPRVHVDFYLCQSDEPATNHIDNKIVVFSKAAETGLAPACYMWDYLRRSDASGFFLPLSGGADSGAVAAIVYEMSILLFEDIKKNSSLLNELRRVLKDDKFVPKKPQDIMKRIFFTAYMQTKNSSESTKIRAKKLSEEIGSNHYEINIDEICESFSKSVSSTLKFEPRFQVNGGTMTEDLALQNVQARSRMVLAYFMAQLLTVEKNIKGYLLVLAAGNLDEGLRGYMTKYDCSSADLNPIGSYSKIDLQNFLKWSAKERNLTSIMDIVNATPTAELRPLDQMNKLVQTDEEEMGMTYEELSIFGRLRKICKYGPVGMFKKLAEEWKHLDINEISEKVKRFFKFYSINRHKMTVLTPAIHAETYSADDNRYDLRQFLYNTKWPYQFKKIDELVFIRYIKYNK